jgi:predicted membrane chloride channel (bestrophin family)
MRHGRATLISSNKTIFRPILACRSFNSTNNRATSSREFSSTDTGRVVPLKDDSPFIKRAERSALRPSLYHISSPNATRIERKSRLCPTRDMNYTPEMWARHKAPGRHIKNLLSVFGCAPFQRLVFPDLFLTATVAAGVTYYNEIVGVVEPFYFDKTAFTSCCMAISVLAGFRLNTSYSRFNEARMILGYVNNTSRDLMGQACMFLNDENKQRMQKLLKAFSVALHFHLNTKGGYYKLDSSDPETKAKVNAAYRDEMREIFSPHDDNFEDTETVAKNDLSASDFEIICEAYVSGSHVPLLILSFMRKTIIENEPPINPIYGVDMDQQVSMLTVCLGGCERILRTPVPVSIFESSFYNRLFLYGLLLVWTSPLLLIFSHLPFKFYLSDQNRLHSLRVQVGMFPQLLR